MPTKAFPVCLAREISEEASVVASVGALLDAFAYEVIGGRWVNVIVYACHIAADQTPVASHEHQQVALIDSDDLPATGLPAEYRRAIDLGLQT